MRELSENSNKINETDNQTQESGGDIDFGATILNADVGEHVRKNKNLFLNTFY